MGNEVSTAKPPSGLDSYVEELGDIHYERRYFILDVICFIISNSLFLSLGNARFMKTIRGRHKDSLVVAKIYIKREGTNFSFTAYTEKATRMFAYTCAPFSYSFDFNGISCFYQSNITIFWMCPMRLPSNGSFIPSVRSILSVNISTAVCMIASGTASLDKNSQISNEPNTIS